MLGLRRKLFDVLIWIVERELYRTPIAYALDDERALKFFAALWAQPGFREYCIERETRFVHSLATQDDPIMRAQMRGQRIEMALWFGKAKKAYDKQFPAKGPEKIGSPRKP